MLLKKIFNKIVESYYGNRLNIFQTFWANFLYLPLSQAIKFPILVYGPCSISGMGNIIFSEKTYTGMLKLGLSDPVRSAFDKSFIRISGDLFCGNRVILRRGIKMEILERGEVHIANDVSIGHNVTIICRTHIQIGRATSVGNNTTFMDNDFHFVINTTTKTVKDFKDTIEIGVNNWIGGWCTIKKGTKTPMGTIIAGPYSMTSKNYIDKIPEYSIIGGSPAKLIVENMRRINNDIIQKKLFTYFENNIQPYQFPQFIDLDEVCLPESAFCKHKKILNPKQ